MSSRLYPIFAALAHYVQYLTKPQWLATCFLLCAVPTGLGCALLTPIGMFPDEAAHATRADGLRYGQFLGFKPSPRQPNNAVNAGVVVNRSIFLVLGSEEAALAYPDKPVPPAARLQAESIPWLKGQVYNSTQMVEYFPIFYVPAALGLLAGEKSGLSPLHTFYLGRVAMLICYVLLGTAALALTRFGGPLLFTILTLPTAINLGSSYNEDGLLTASCVLAAALLTRRKAKFSIAWLIALVVLTGVVSAKLPYGALLLLCLTPVLTKGIWRRAMIILLACTLPGAWLLHIAHSGFIDYVFPISYHPGPLWPGSRDIVMHDTVPQNNIKVLLAHPAEILLLPINSLMLLWLGTWPNILGMISCDDVLISPWEFPFLVIALAAASVASLRDWRASWRTTDTILTALAIFAAFICMELSLYLTATLAGFNFILGVRGRYFLPLMPFFIFILPWAGSQLARLPGARKLPCIPAGWFCLPPVTMATVNAYALPSYIFHLFQMPGP